MAEEQRDAFGNPIGSGDSSTPASEAVASPSSPTSAADAFAAPEPKAKVKPAPEQPRRPAQPERPRPRSGRALRLLFYVLCLGVLAYVLWQADEDAQDSAAVVGRDLDGRALAPISLLRESNLREALLVVRAEMRQGEEALSLRVVPEGMSVRVRDPNGNARVIAVDLALEADASDSGEDTTSAVLDLDEIDPGVPQRIVREALRQTGTRDDRKLEYLSISGDADGRPTWYLSLDDVPIADQTWTADLAGIAVTHPGELPAASGVQPPSLMAPGPLRKALAQVGTVGRRVVSIRLAPERLDVTVVRPGGKLASVQIDAAQRMTVDETTGSSTVLAPLTAIDLEGVQRGVETAARRGGFSPNRIDYGSVVEISSYTGEEQLFWYLFFEEVPEGRSSYRSTLSGRKVTKL